MDGDKTMDLAPKALPRQLRRQYLKKGPRPWSPCARWPPRPVPTSSTTMR